MGVYKQTVYIGIDIFEHKCQMNAYNKNKIHALFSRSAMIRPLYVYYTKGEGKWHNLCS